MQIKYNVTHCLLYRLEYIQKQFNIHYLNEMFPKVNKQIRLSATLECRIVSPVAPHHAVYSTMYAP
jgi:hypothetical protein